MATNLTDSEIVTELRKIYGPMILLKVPNSTDGSKMPLRTSLDNFFRIASVLGGLVLIAKFLKK